MIIYDHAISGRKIIERKLRVEDRWPNSKFIILTSRIIEGGNLILKKSDLRRVVEGWEK